MRNEEEIEVVPAVIEAGAAKIFAMACYIPGLFLTHEECREFATESYRVMERARRAEAEARLQTWTDTRNEWFNMKYGSVARSVPPPGHRNASEDEPERTAGWKLSGRIDRATDQMPGITEAMPIKSAISSSAEWRRLREIIGERSLRKDREYTLSSGEKSGYYFDMKPTTLDPEGLNLTASIIYNQISDLRGIYVGGLAVGAVPIVSALVLHSASRIPMMGFYVRAEIKDHGTEQLIEGFLQPDANVVMLDDVTTAGSSVMKAVEAVRQYNCKVIKIITVVDRMEGAAERFRREGLEFLPIFTTKDLTRDTEPEFIQVRGPVGWYKLDTRTRRIVDTSDTQFPNVPVQKPKCLS